MRKSLLRIQWGKWKFLLSYILLCNFYAVSQDTNFVVKLEIGKRNSWIFDREINFYRLGKFDNTYNRIFFRTSSMEDYTPIGFLGFRIRPYLVNNPKAMVEFRKYRKNKLLSYLPMVAIPFVNIAWIIDAVSYTRMHRARIGRNYPLNLIPTERYYLYPALLVGLVIGGITTSMQADENMVMAVYHANGKRKMIR